MEEGDIKFVNEQLRCVRTGLTDMFRESIVKALREGTVWKERFELMERNIERQIEIGFFKHYTIENVRNLMNNIKEQYPLDKRIEKPLEKKPDGLYEYMIDKMAMEYIKKLVSKFFDKVDKVLEKE